MNADVRATAGLFRLGREGLIEVTGADRVGWLNGMVSNDVAALGPGHASGDCHALLLTHRGAIIADLHVVWRADRFWLLVARDAVAGTLTALEKFIVADDVTLTDASDAHAQWTLEGPAAAQILAALAVDATLEPGADAAIAGQPVTLVPMGLSGEWARRLIAPAAGADAVERAVLEAGAAFSLALGDDEALEVLRVEAGSPRQGFELHDDVLPAEARLDAAISTTKGCYVGQEIVARLRSRGHVNHLLVGLRFDSAADATPAVPAAPAGPPAAGTELRAGDKRTGELTSVASSPRVGGIALGYVRREHSDPGTELDAGGQRAVVAALPFVAPSASTGGHAARAPGVDE